MKILNTKLGRQAIAAALVLSLAIPMSMGAFAEEPAADTLTDDTVVAGYLPPQDESVMIQGDIMLLSSGLTTTLPSDTLVESPTDTTPKVPYTVQYTVKGLLGKQVLYTATQEGRVMTLSAPEDVATFRTTVGEMQKLLNQGVSTVVLMTNKASTTLNLTLLCEGQEANTKVTLRHVGDSAFLTVGLRCRRDLIVGR